MATKVVVDMSAQLASVLAGAPIFAVQIILSKNIGEIMIRSEAIEALSRRLGLNPGRASALAQRAAEAGALPKARGRCVPDLGPVDLARLFLVVVADRGLGHAAATVTEFEALATESGIEFGGVLRNIIEGLVEPAAYARGGLIFRLVQPGATLIVNDVRLHFGAAVPEDAATKSVTIPGATLAAIAYEFRGFTSAEADAEIHRLLGVRHAA